MQSSMNVFERIKTLINQMYIEPTVSLFTLDLTYLCHFVQTPQSVTLDLSQLSLF